MNGLDVAIAVMAGLGVLWGLGRGVLRMATAIIALGAGLYFASVYYPAARDLAMKHLSMGAALAAVVGYAVVFLVVAGVVETTGGVLIRLVHTVNMGWADRLAGAVAGGAIAIAVTGLLLMLLTAALPTDAALLKQSQLAPRVLAYTGALIEYIPPEIKMIYERKRHELMRYWFRQEFGEEGNSPSATVTP
jgi:membrane protein required for colicin V production